MKSAEHPTERSRVAALLLVLVAAGTAGVMVCRVPSPPGRSAAGAVDGTLLSRDEAIARIESLGGTVGIDGEAPDQPVWRVDLSGTRVTGSTLQILRSFPKLEVLYLSKSELDDEALAALEQLPQLKELDLTATRVTDAGMRHLSKLSELSILILDQTAVTDAGIRRLSALKKLGVVSVVETRITPEGLEARRLAAMDVSEPGGSRAGNLPPLPRAAGLNRLGKLALMTAGRDEAERRKAVELLERAVEADPQNDLLKIDLADAYVLLDQELLLALAADLYEDVLERRANDEQLLGRLATTFAALENFDEAFDYARQRLLRVEGKTVYEAALQVVGIVTGGGDLDQGIGLLRSAVREHPEDLGVRLLLATLLAESDGRSEARDVVERVIQQSAEGDPILGVARQMKQRLQEVRP